MKTSIKFVASALAFVLSVSASSFALGPGDQPEQKAFAIAMFPANDVSKVWLCLEKYKVDDKISVELLNEKGQVMFREALPAKGGKKNGYRQQFDLSQVGDGKYTFRISDGNQTEERTFKLTTPTIEQQLPTRLISMN
ncbi:hypothetical protein G8759_33415 [Spirosoma aureum]|uniref:T9SS type A sorting domain-containing protein n=1 Tax=Spirosoma aureum TaxID=2692134 RepID=A0A6G9AXK3_9BACT|nr:hypothetical protein [Spirosoma aureum]QIP17192.1 hypothetical protein G8759_33415 [Spirosoma aureum]